MAAQARETIAFGRPGGETCAPSRGRPIDLVHLTRQTLGDRALEQEVLGMFVQQLGTFEDRLSKADATDRRMLAHTLRGSAAGVGAFAIADCAGKLEDDPSSQALIEKLSGLIGEACDFIAAINR